MCGCVELILKKKDPQAQILSEFGLSGLIKDTRMQKRQTLHSCPTGNRCHSNKPLLYFPPRKKKKTKPAGRFRKG